jgi:hypothetical protein
MRSLVVALAVCTMFLSALAGRAQAVGFDVVGKEDCKCSPLVARGIVPDTLNKLKEAFVFPSLFVVVERMAGEIKAIVSQFGVKPMAALEPPLPTPSLEKKTEAKEKPIEIKPLKEKSKEKKKKTAKKKSTSKKRRIKQPPRAM